MKKLLILTAALMFGVGSVFADPYEVIVSWSYITPFYCQSQLTNEYEFEIILDIYDVVNDKQVTDTPTINYEDWGETETTFSATQTKVEDWCDEATSTPSLRVVATVRMKHKTTQDIYCSKTVVVYRTCAQFSGGIAVSVVFN